MSHDYQAGADARYDGLLKAGRELAPPMPSKPLGIPGCEPVARVTAGAALEDLEKSLYNLYASLDRLADRLEPVLEPAKASPTQAGSAEHNATNLVSRLIQLRQRVETANNEIAWLTNRVQL